MVSQSPQLQVELAYQREQFLRTGEVTPTPDYIFERYRRSRFWPCFNKEFMFHALGDLTGKSVLDFGCGDGRITTQLATLGACVTAIDVAPEWVAAAEQRAVLDGVRDRVSFQLGDVTETHLPENHFDAVVCHKVLHHLDIPSVLPILYSSLKPGGIAVIVEPIAFSARLQAVRDAIPVEKDTSPGERQLNRKDLAYILGTFPRKHVVFFDMLGRMSRLLPNANAIDKGHPFTKTALVLLLGMDRVLLACIPSLSKYCGTVVVVGQK